MMIKDVIKVEEEEKNVCLSQRERVLMIQICLFVKLNFI